MKSVNLVIALTFLLLITVSINSNSQIQSGKLVALNGNNIENTSKYVLTHYNTGWIYETHSPVCPETVTVTGRSYQSTLNTGEDIAIIELVSTQQNEDGSPFYKFFAIMSPAQFKSGNVVAFKDNMGIEGFEANGAYGRFFSVRDNQYAVGLWSNYGPREGEHVGEIHLENLDNNTVSGTFHITLWADGANSDPSRYVKIENGVFSVPRTAK